MPGSPEVAFHERGDALELARDVLLGLLAPVREQNFPVAMAHLCAATKSARESSRNGACARCPSARTNSCIGRRAA